MPHGFQSTITISTCCHRTTSRVAAPVSLGETGQTRSTGKYIFLPSALNFAKSMWEIRKKIIIFKKSKIVERKKKQLCPGGSLVSWMHFNIWKMLLPQASRRLLFPRCCGLHFHILSVAVCFPFTSLPSVPVYTTGQLCFSYRLPALICCYMHSGYKT